MPLAYVHTQNANEIKVESTVQLTSSAVYLNKVTQSPDYNSYNTEAFGNLDLAHALLYHSNDPRIKAVTIPIISNDGYQRFMVSFFNTENPNPIEFGVTSTNIDINNSGDLILSLTSGEMLSKSVVTGGQLTSQIQGTSARSIGFMQCMNIVDGVCDSHWWCRGACAIDPPQCAITFGISCAAVSLYYW
ncbi:hypothetical protein [Hymenobacter agri]